MALSYDLIKTAVTAVQSHTYGLNDTVYTVTEIWEADTGGLHNSHSFNRVKNTGTQITD